MKKKPSKWIAPEAAKNVRYSPAASPDRIVPLTARELELLIGSLGHEWGVLQSKLVEFASGDEGVSGRAVRRRIEELDMLTAKLGGHR